MVRTYLCHPRVDPSDLAWVLLALPLEVWARLMALPSSHVGAGHGRHGPGHGAWVDPDEVVPGNPYRWKKMLYFRTEPKK